MSEAGTKERPLYKSRWLRWANPAEKGSKKWFWQMRIVNIHLWLTPLIVMATALVQFRWPAVKNPSTVDRLVFSLPWVGVGVTAAALAYALWRIEVNMEGGKRPFTAKDAAVYKQAMMLQVIVSSIVMMGFLVYMFYALLHMPTKGGVEDRMWSILDAMYAPLAAMYLLLMFTQTMRRTHTKAHEYYEELEKGV